MKVLYRFIPAFMLSGMLFAQNVSVVATVDSQSVTIGDWIHLSLTVKHPPATHVFLPVLKDTLGTFEIVHQDSAATKDEEGVRTLEKTLVISKYTPGNFYIPPITVMFTDAGGTVDSASSNPIPISVQGIQVDTTQSIKDIKAPLTVPMSAAEIAMYIGLVLALAGAGYGIYYYIKKKRKVYDVLEEELPKIPPHVEAIQRLFDLEEEHLWQSGEIKLFYSKATEIIREYFEKRYGIMALELTTGEVMTQMARFKLDASMSGMIERFLSDADLVKFAKYQPIASENEAVIPAAKEIVEKTKPIEKTGPEAENTEEGTNG